MPKPDLHPGLSLRPALGSPRLQFQEVRGLQSVFSGSWWAGPEASRPLTASFTDYTSVRRVLPGRALPWRLPWLVWGFGQSKKFGFNSVLSRRTWSQRGTRGREWGQKGTRFPPATESTILGPTLRPVSRRRTFLQAVSSEKVRSTNFNCLVTADVRHDGSEPCVDVLFGGHAWGVRREGRQAARTPKAPLSSYLILSFLPQETGIA